MKSIVLSQNKCALVDDVDYDSLNRYKWYAQKAGRSYYAVRHIHTLKGKSQGLLGMHRAILDAPIGVEVDHRNGKGLDNRRSNLRLCNRGENCRHQQIRRGSRTGFKGVTFNGRNCGKPYQALIRVNGKLIFLGDYRLAKQAARVYDRAALKHYGEFALTNKECKRRTKEEKRG